MESLPSNSIKQDENVTISTFKKPVLIGKIGRLPRKTNVVPPKENISEESVQIENKNDDVEVITKDEPVLLNNEEISKDSPSTDQPAKDQNLPFSYNEPSWSGMPVSEVDYNFEVLKSGVIIERINLMKKAFLVFGRLQTCDVYMAHPTISRYHAVVQYKAETSAERPTGFYIYDMGSTHGTFLNKNRIKPKMYVRIQVGHMLKLGCSTRTFLLVGPSEDTETESTLTITELKEKRLEDLRQRELKVQQNLQDREEKKKRDENRGVDWGMGEDADEESDLTENPYAETTNEELYLEDPKKTLRGFMEREGHELHYEVAERGVGQFLCSVVLPLDDARGRPLVAEALVKGKKKEAVVQCALEACRILDRHGVLRQAMHESKKRKAKNWEENDYYDSDEDTFLDRTGTIERKREKRMKAKQPQQTETYQSLIVKEEKLTEEIRNIEKQINDLSQAGSSRNASESNDVDSLDHFMSELNSNKPDKYATGKLKNELNKLRKDHSETIRLINIARPAHLPALVPQTNTSSQEGPSTSGTKTPQPKSLPIYGKRLKVKVMLPSREMPNVLQDVEAAEEEDEPEEVTSEVRQESGEPEGSEAPSRKGIIKQLEIKMSLCDEKALASLDNKVKAKISKTVTKLRKIAEEEERIVVDEKRLAVQKKKIFEQMNATDAKNIEKHIKLSSALNKMTTEFCTIGDRKLKIVEKINKLADDINNIAVEIRAASKVQHEQAVNRMKEFVEKAHKQQTEIFGELEKLEHSVTDQKVIDKLKELYEWLTTQKNQMLDNLERLKNVKLSEDSKLLEDIIEFEVKSDNFITTILEEIRKIRTNNETSSPPKKLKIESPSSSSSTNNILDDNSDEDESSSSPADLERRKKKNLRRIVQRQEKAEAERKKQYEEDAKKEDYNMWVPPAGQTGDGRTNLNDKLGY